MPRTKISEFSATPANNTDIDSINIAEGCAPSGINDAIRELMSQLKDFQTGAVGDSFNGPVGSTTASTGAFTTLSASSTVSGTGFSTYLASPPAIGGTAAAAVSATTLAASGAVTLSGGTANGVTYLNGSKVLTSGSALTFDGTNLGLGVSSPAAKFAISSGTTDTRMYIQNTATGTAAGNGLGLFMISTDSYMFNYNGAILFGASGFETMRLTSTGLGIGTSSPRAKLDVSGSVLVGTYQTSTNYAPLSVKTASTITTPSTFTNAISIWNGTNVGEYSNITFGYNTVGVTNAAAYMGYVSTSSTDQGKGALVFGTRDVTSDTAASERMRLDSAGNLLVGTTNGGGQTGVGIFTQTAAASDCLTANATSASFVSSILNIRTTRNTTNNTFKAIQYYNDGATAYKFYVIDSGAIYSTSTTITSISDQRFKENIKDIDVGLDAVMALKPRRFDWIDGKGEDRKNAVGFIAQEMQTVLPDLISTYEQSPEDTTEYLAIRQSDLIPTLVKAIQEQQAIIESLKARLDAANL